MKKIISFILTFAIVFSAFGINAFAASENASLLSRPDSVRIFFDGIFEQLFRTLASKTEKRNNYDEYTELCTIPETENGYVPQGFCYCEKADKYVITAYHDEKASVLIFVDAENGTFQTVELKGASGKNFTGHVGGVATDGVYLYISNGSGFSTVLLDDALNVEDGGSVSMSERITLDVKSSYLSCDGEYFYAGEFYTYTKGGSYNTDPSHHAYISFTETSYARCNAYRISDIQSCLDTGNAPAPAFVLSVPNRVQGFARMDNGGFALSISYGRSNDSFLINFEDVTLGEPDFTVQYGGETVSGYHLSKAVRTEKLRMPPMLEGIDTVNGKTVGIFESGAQKYSDSAFIVNSICEL